MGHSHVKNKKGRFRTSYCTCSNPQRNCRTNCKRGTWIPGERVAVLSSTGKSGVKFGVVEAYRKKRRDRCTNKPWTVRLDEKYRRGKNGKVAYHGERLVL